MTNAEIAANLLTYINTYVGYDSDTKTVNVDLQSFVSNIQPQLATVRAAFTSAVMGTYEGADDYTLNSAEELAAAVAVIGEPIDNMLTTLAGVQASDLLGNAEAVGRLLAYYIVQWRSAENYDPVGGLLDQMNELLDADSQEAIANNINQAIVMPFVQTRGIQTVADQLANGFSEGSIDLTGGLVLLPALTDMIDDDSRANIREIIGIITNTLKDQILADGNDLAPNRFNIALNGGIVTFNPNILSVYITDLDALGTSSLQPIDASEDTVGAFRILLAGNLDGSEGESLIGSSGNDIIIAGGYDTVDGNGGNDLIVIEDGSSTVETGTITDPNSGFEYTTVTGSIYKDNHTQQVIGIATVGTSTVIGFETGWESDEGDPDLIFADNINVLTFDFDDNGLIVNDGAGSLILAADVFSTVADLLINDTKARVINDNQTVEATDADRYYLPQGSVLTNVTGTVDIDDCRFSTSGNLTVNGGTYTFADGSAYWFAASAYGLSAGDTVSVGDLWSDPDAAKVYRVSDDGTQIIRDEDGTVVYEGDPSTLASMNIGPITFADYYGGQIATGVQTFITKYVSFDGNQLIVNADQLQADIKAGIEGYRNELEGAAVDVAVQYLSSTVANILGINVSFDYLLSQDAIDRLKNNISAKMQDTDNAADAIIADLDEYSSGVGLYEWIYAKVFVPLQEEYGLQEFGRGFVDVVDENNNFVMSRWLDLAKPLLADQFSNEYTGKVLAANIDAVGQYLINKIRADGGGDGVVNVIFDGEDAAALDVFLTPLDSLGNTVGNILDASDSTVDTWMFSKTAGDSITGSPQSDFIYVDNAATINGNGGLDVITFTSDGSRQVLNISAEDESTVIGFEYDVDVLNIDPYEFFELRVKIDFDDDGLTVFDGDGSIFLPVADFDTVSANLLVQDQHVTAINKNQSVDATGADRYMLCDAATLGNFTGKAIVNDITFSVTSPVSIVALERANRGNRIVNGIFGVSANDTVKLANSDGANEITYVVNADGTEITRADNGRVVWEGTAEEFAALDFLTVDYQEYYGGIFTAHVEALLDQYVTFDDGNVTIDRKSFRENLAARITRLTAQLDSDSTVEDALNILVNDLNTQFDVDLTEAFSAQVLGAIQTQMSAAIEQGNNPFTAAFGLLTGLLSPIAHAFWDSTSRLGVQTFAADEANLFSGNGSIIENLGIDPLLQELFNTRSARRMVHNVVEDYRERFLDEFDDGHLNLIIQSADETINHSMFLGAPDPAVIATVAGDINVIMNSFEGSTPQVLVGTDGNDAFHVGAGDTVYAGAGHDRIIFADGDTSINATINFDSSTPLEITSSRFNDAHSRQTVVLEDGNNATVSGFEVGWSIDGGETDLISVDNINDLTFDFDDDGLIISNGNGSLFLASNDAAMIPTVNPNAISDSRTPSSTVSTDLWINGLKATAINANQTIDATGADYYFLLDDATVNGADSLAHIIHIGKVEGQLINNTLDNTLISGTDADDTIINSGSNVTIDGAGGDDLITLSSADREFVVLDTDTAATVTGFETGWSIDGGETDMITVDAPNDLTFDFDDNGLIVNDGDGSLLLNDAELSTLSADLLINDQKVTAVNAAQSLDANGADHYFLDDGSTLKGFTGSAVINDYMITTNATLDIVAEERSTGARLLNEIYGLSAGDSITTALADGSDPTTYVVSDDGTSLTRVDTGTVLWTGTAEELSELNFLDVEYIDYYSELLENAINNVISRYVTFDGDNLTIDGTSFRSDVHSQLAIARQSLSSLENPTADNVIELLDGIVQNVFGEDVVLSYILNDETMTRLTARITSWIENGTDPFAALGALIDTPAGFSNFVRSTIVDAVAAERGIQAIAVEVTNIFDSSGNLSFINQLKTFLPTIGNILNSNVTDYFRIGLDNIARDLFARISTANGDDNFINIVVLGSSGRSELGMYFTKLGIETLMPIDASQSTVENNLIVGNIAGSAGESITGSAQRDVILVGDGDTVNGNGGGDLIIFADGDVDMTMSQSIDTTSALPNLVEAALFNDAHTRQVLNFDTNTTATVVGFEVGWSLDGSLGDSALPDMLTVDSIDGLSFDFDDNGLIIANGDGSLFLASDDSAVLPTVNANAISDSRTPSSTVSADLLINGLKVTAVNAGQTIDATGADYYFLLDDATVNGADSLAHVIHVEKAADQITTMTSGVREFLELDIDSDSAITAVGFETGFEDTSDVVSIANGAITDLKFEFTDDGLIVHNTGTSWDEDGQLTLNDVSADADLLIQDDDGLHQARAFASDQSITVGDVELNYVNGDSTVNATTSTEIINGGSNVLINGSDDADTIINNLEIVDGDSTVGNVTLNAGAGADNIEAGGGNGVLINGGDDNDTVVNWSGLNTTVNGGAGNDALSIHDGTNELINGGAGDDTIWADNETNATLDGGAGNDLIMLSEGSNVIRFRADDGADSVVGLTANDTIIVEGDFSTVAGSNNVMVSLESGSMILYGAATLDNINIINASDTVSPIADTLIAAGLVEYTQHKIDSLSAPSLAAEYFHNDYDYDWQPSLSVGSETWTIQSADELALNAVHYEPAESTGKWVVLVHGYGGNHTTMREFVNNYLAVGYDVLAIDQRAAGESEGEWLTMGAAEAQDVALWTQEIARRVPTSKITLHGVSMGAATVMLAAARSDCANLMAVVEDCGYASAYDLFSQLVPVLTPYSATIMPVMDMMSSLMTGHALTEATPLDVIDDVTVPSMFIHGTADMLIAPSNADSLYAASGAEVKTLYNVEGAGHGRSGIDYNEEYGANLFQFLDNNDGSGVIYGYLSNMTVGGTDDADSIINVGTENTINAFDGDDWITLGGTSWTVEGDQTLQSTGNNVVVDAGAGDDSIRSRHSYWTTLIGGDGNDFINVSDGHYMNIDGGDGDDSIIGTRLNWGMGGHATIEGGDGNDYIRAGYANDSSILGGAGNDTILVDGPNVTIDGGDGNDVVSLNADTDRTPLGSTDNVVIARANTTIYGLDGDDLLLFADGRRDKSIYFTANGIEFHTDTVMSPDADYVSVLLPDHTDTAVMKLQYSLDGGAITCAFINGRATYSVAEDGFADEYVEVSDYGAVDFTSITSDINITLDNQANIDDPIKFANINTIISGNGLNTITMSDKAAVVVANSGSITINNFKTGSAGATDRLIFADGLTDKVVDFTADGLSFYTNTVMSPDVDPVSVLLSGITSTTLINLSYDNADTSVFIKEGDTYAASLGQANRYVAITNHGGVDFTGVSDALDITLGNNYLNIDTLIGGEGSTNVLGTSADETFIIGNGQTTVNGNGGNDVVRGLKDGDIFIIDSNITGSNVVGNALVLTTDDGNVSLMGDSLKGGNSILISKGHTIVGSGGLDGIYTSDDGATIDAPNSQVTLDSYTYTIAGDDDGVSISGNSLSGVDAASTITFGNAGDYYVNGGLVTVEAGGTLRETDMLSGDTMAVDGGEWFLGSSEYGTLIATDARALIHSNSSDLTIVTGANTTMDPHAGLTVVDYDPTTNSGFSLNGGDPTFGDGVIGLGEGNTVSGLSSNAAKLYYDSDTTLAAWTGSDGLLDRSDSTKGEYLIANVDSSTVISGSGNDTIDLRADGVKVRYGDGRDTVLNFNSSDVLYQDEYSDKNVTLTADGLKFYDRSSALMLSDVIGSTEVTWQFGADETVHAVYVAENDDYSVASLADEYVGMRKNTGVDFSAIEDDLSIDANVMLSNIVRVTLGSGDSTFVGSKRGELITLTDGAAEIELSRGHDTIVGFKPSEDRLVIDGDFSVKVDGDDVLIATGGSYLDRTVLQGMATVDSALTIGDDQIKAGSTMTYAEGVTAYVGADNATLNVEESAAIWLGVGNTYFNVRTVDGSNAEGDLLIAGTDKSDLLIGGAGSNSLWGGVGGRDTLIGGDGSNEFFYAKGNGWDVVENAHDDDVINLLSLDLDDIRSIDADSASVTMKFEDGGRLSIASSADLTYNLNGDAYTLDRSSKTLQRK